MTGCVTNKAGGPMVTIGVDTPVVEAELSISPKMPVTIKNLGGWLKGLFADRGRTTRDED